MRTSIASCLLATFLCSTAFAQIGTTDSISSSTLSQPFKPQSAVGGGVPVTAQMPVAPAPAINPTTIVPAVQQAAPAAAGFGLNKAFDEADANRDGEVTRAEFLALAERHFGMADTNKDGKITRAEMQAQQNQMMQRMLKNGNWQQKLEGFIGGGAPAVNLAPTAPSVVRPAAPVVPAPVAPVAPTY